MISAQDGWDARSRLKLVLRVAGQEQQDTWAERRVYIQKSINRREEGNPRFSG